MRHLKMLGLAVVVSAALTAMGEAGTASATTLCTTADSPGCTMAYTSGTTIDLSLIHRGTAGLTSPAGTTILTCSESIIKGKITQTSGTWIEVDLEALTWGQCSLIVDTVVNGKLSVMWTSETIGEVVGEGTEVTTVIGGVSCVYTFGEGIKLGTIAGSSEPTLKIETKIKKAEGSFVCPVEPTMDAEYVLTEPHALFVVN